MRGFLICDLYNFYSHSCRKRDSQVWEFSCLSRENQILLIPTPTSDTCSFFLDLATSLFNRVVSPNPMQVNSLIFRLCSRIKVLFGEQSSRPASVSNDYQRLARYVRQMLKYGHLDCMERVRERFEGAKKNSIPRSRIILRGLSRICQE